jgi:phosphohistidine phosphatase
MDILLIRHGQAVDEAPGLGDAGRWLTGKGRKVSRKVAKWVAKGGKRTPRAIWTSPLARSVQTAEILAAATGWKGEVRVCPQLSPGHDPGDLLKLLASESGTIDGPIALVGHEPSLSLIANALLGDVGFTGLKKSGILALTWDAPGEGRLNGGKPGKGAKADKSEKADDSDDDAEATPTTVAQAEPPASSPTGASGRAKLWFVLDPTHMKSRKTLAPRAESEAAAATEDA